MSDTRGPTTVGSMMKRNSASPAIAKSTTRRSTRISILQRTSATRGSAQQTYASGMGAVRPSHHHAATCGSAVDRGAIARPDRSRVMYWSM